MYLPENALYCISALEKAGYPCYAVGGCVRDALLGLQPHDYDLCTAAPPDKIKEIFGEFPQIHAGEKHGTIGVIFPQGEIYEITTFRTEGAYADNRHPDWVAFVSDIEQDLARRDFTVNAMAYSPTRGFADPFGGRQDLNDRVLRAVGVPERRFKEDALRILRAVRFSVTYDLKVEPATLQAMLALAPTMEMLARERVLDELCKLILKINHQQLADFAPVLTQIIPELGATLGFDQKNPHHCYDIYTHIAYVVEQMPPVLYLRWAALLHDVGKPLTFTVDDDGIGHFYGHAEVGADLAQQILRRLKAPNELREKVVCLVRYHMTPVEPEQKTVRRRLSRMGAETLDDLLTLQEADRRGTGIADGDGSFEQVRALIAQIQAEKSCLSLKELAVNGRDLKALGFEGPQIGQILHRLLDAVLDGQLPNEKEILLSQIRKGI